jgi:hypothetical protein
MNDDRRSAFLIAAEPSFAETDTAKLGWTGCLTMALSDAVPNQPPDMWASMDDSARFVRWAWLSPKITKFVPLCHTEKRIFDNEKWEKTDQMVGELSHKMRSDRELLIAIVANQASPPGVFSAKRERGISETAMSIRKRKENCERGDTNRLTQAD